MLEPIAARTSRIKHSCRVLGGETDNRSATGTMAAAITLTRVDLNQAYRAVVRSCLWVSIT